MKTRQPGTALGKADIAAIRRTSDRVGLRLLIGALMFAIIIATTTVYLKGLNASASILLY